MCTSAPRSGCFRSSTARRPTTRWAASAPRYLATFNRPNVELISEKIDRVTARGIRTLDGREREIDVLVLATGFRLATDPENYRLNPVRGRDGFDLATFYAGKRARSYESVSLPGLPNRFMIFGPYGWTGGTWHVLVETASRHIVRVIEEAPRRHGGRGARAGRRAVDAFCDRAPRALAVERRVVRDRQQLLLRPPW